MIGKQVERAATIICRTLADLPADLRCDALALACKLYIETNGELTISAARAVRGPFGPVLGPIKRSSSGRRK